MRSLTVAMPDQHNYKSTTIARVFTHRVKTDYENGRNERPKLPMVFVFDDNRTVITKEWQMYLVAMNYLMKDNQIAHMLGDDVAFCNNTGFNGTHHCRNYILMEDMENELPKWDKTRTCGDAKLFINGTQVKVMDGSKPPLLRPGFSHPADTAEAYKSWNRYVYNPINAPELFFACTVTGTDNHAHAWPGAAFYPWYKNSTEPVSWMFHVSDAPVTYPPQQWTSNTPYMEVLP